MTPYIQNNIPYLFVWPKNEQMVGYKRFVYNWEQTQTSMKGKTYIYCRSLEDLIGLVNYWNKQEYWRYWIENNGKEL